MRAHLCISFFGLYFLCQYTSAMTSTGRKGKHCKLDTSSNGISAGVARDVIAICKFNTYNQKFYYQISWKYPEPKKTKVDKYLVTIKYDISRLCFQVNSTSLQLVFDESHGFKHGEGIQYAVTPQPITRTGGSFRTEFEKGTPCPPAIRLISLPNKVIAHGSNFSFKCMFEETPMHNVSVEWYFTADIRYCKDTHRITSNTSKHFVLSRDQKVLKIVKAKKEHEGCYKLVVKDGDGHIVDEDQGYIHINQTVVALTRKSSKGPTDTKTQLLIALSVGSGLLLLIAIVVGVKLWYKKHNFVLLDRPEEPLMKVYISHCVEKKNEKFSLLKFAGVIKFFKIDVMLDLCSEVEINLGGGLSRWIPLNIQRADKIIVILTPLYVSILQSGIPDDSELDENIRKIHAECNYINNIMHDNLHKSNHVLLLSKGVESHNFPIMFQNKLYFEFPKNLKFDKNENLDKDVKQIVEALLE